MLPCGQRSPHNFQHACQVNSDKVKQREILKGIELDSPHLSSQIHGASACVSKLETDTPSLPITSCHIKKDFHLKWRSFSSLEETLKYSRRILHSALI